MEREQIEARIRAISQSAADAKGLEFVHSEVAGTKRNAVVRVFVDKPGGVTLDDCGELSRDIEGVLDIEDIVPSSYVLEVSSPGLERELYSIADFQKFTGESARIKTREAVDGRKSYKGSIVGVDGENILFEEKTLGQITIPYSNVAKANLVFDLSEELKRK
ncbi:MAG TPA: ribosome maturation factor RimP [Pyrinomonadaceae bacterium]|nr:ribosome maturation factor RimP [Pyrinomonadaceae bacterium]